MSSTLTPHSTRGDGITPIVAIANVGLMIVSGATVPTDGTVGFAPGCLFLRTSGNGINTSLYVNEGSRASCDFNAK